MNTFRFPSSDWDAAKRAAHAAMVAAARSASGTITYGELAEKIATIIRFEPDANAFHELLGQISETENEKGSGMLSVVVIHKDGDMRPGAGFFKLAQKLGYDTHDRDKFWASEFERVRKVWRR